MNRVYIKKTQEYIGQEVELVGFCQVIRDQGKIKFIILRDISGIIQLVILPDFSQALKV